MADIVSGRAELVGSNVSPPNPGASSGTPPSSYVGCPINT